MSMSTDFKIFAMDFDLTLIDYQQGRGMVGENTRAALMDLITKGFEVGIVSGRYWWQMRDILEPNGLIWGSPFPTFIISREALIFYLKDGKMEEEKVWNDRLRQEMLDFSIRIGGWLPEIANSLTKEQNPFYNMVLYGDYAAELHFQSEEKGAAALDFITHEWKSRLEPCRLHRNRSTVNILTVESGKGLTLKKLAENRLCNPGEVIAVGDTLNDLDMLDGRYGFYSAAVGNADEKIKEAVRKNKGFIADKRADQGIFQIITEVIKGDAR